MTRRPYTTSRQNSRTALTTSSPYYYDAYSDDGMGCCNCRGLGCVGLLWALLSSLAVAFSCVGFYLPYWLQGSMRNNTPTYLGVWRRCNYLRMVDDHIETVLECGRYETFLDVPSVWWQVGTVTAGTGCGLLLLAAFLGCFGCCCAGVVTRRTARGAAYLQLLAGVLLGATCALYPLGWKSTEVQLVCGSSADIFSIGHCRLLWAYWVCVAAAGLAVVCSILGCQACPKPPAPKQTQTWRQSRDNYMQVSTQ